MQLQLQDLVVAAHESEGEGTAKAASSERGKRKTSGPLPRAITRRWRGHGCVAALLRCSRQTR